MSIRKKISFIKQTLLMTKRVSVPFIQKPKIVLDYLQLYRKKGLTQDEYDNYEFWKQKENFRKTFLGLNEQRFYLDYLNPIKYYSLARNKYIAHKMLEKTGIKKSILYCYYHPEAKYIKSNENVSDLNGVIRILKEKKVQSCVIKTTESSHGDNVWVIKAIDYQETDAVLTRFDDKTLLLSSVLGKEPLIFEGVVIQTKQFASFNKSSVNTVRFMTTLFPNGSAKVIATFIKIGREGKCVDNAGDGGNVDVCVDVDTGEIKYAIKYDGWHNITEIECHPDSGNQLNGIIINNWQSIKEEVIKYQQAFPYCKAAGWDIAITDEGPVVIEVNDFWDRTGQYFIRRGWRNEIRDCYIAWRKYWDEENVVVGEIIRNRQIGTTSDKQDNAGKILINKAEGKEYRMYRQPNALKNNHLREIATYE